MKKNTYIGPINIYMIIPYSRPAKIHKALPDHSRPDSRVNELAVRLNLVSGMINVQSNPRTIFWCSAGYGAEIERLILLFLLAEHLCLWL